MKSRLFVVVLLAGVIGFAGCGGKNNKSNVNTIKSFTVNGVDYEVKDAAGTIMHLYPKTAENTYYGLDNASALQSAKPEIVLTDSKATVSPASGAQVNLSSSVPYKVTAEDGSVKTYTVTVSLGSL